MKGGIQGVRLRCAVMARGVNCDAEGTLAASNARPSYLDILPVEVDVGVEVDLMGEKGTECWLDIAGEDADAGRISRICERCHSHHSIGCASGVLSQISSSGIVPR